MTKFTQEKWQIWRRPKWHKSGYYCNFLPFNWVVLLLLFRLMILSCFNRLCTLPSRWMFWLYLSNTYKIHKLFDILRDNKNLTRERLISLSNIYKWNKDLHENMKYLHFIIKHQYEDLWPLPDIIQQDDSLIRKNKLQFLAAITFAL